MLLIRNPSFVLGSMEDNPDEFKLNVHNVFTVRLLRPVEFCQHLRIRKRNYHLRNTKHVPCFYRVIETRVDVWENEKCCGNTSHRCVFPQLFRVLPNFHECFFNSIETRRTCFLFLLENTATKKKKKKTAC